jgi:hypothetical protein
MYNALPLEQMTIEDKMRTMEALWDDLCRHSDEFNSPNWHHDILAEREQNIRVGEAVFEDWGTAKKRIRESLHGNY